MDYRKEYERLLREPAVTEAEKEELRAIENDEKEIHEYKASDLRFKKRFKKDKEKLQLTKEEMKELEKLERQDKTQGVDD